MYQKSHIVTVSLIYVAIGENSVITAAHCFEKEKVGKKGNKIPIGKYRLRAGLEDSFEYRIKVSNNVLYKILKIRCHLIKRSFFNFSN